MVSILRNFCCDILNPCAFIWGSRRNQNSSSENALANLPEYAQNDPPVHAPDIPPSSSGDNSDGETNVPRTSVVSKIQSSTAEEFHILSSLPEANFYEAPDTLNSHKLNPPQLVPLSQYDHDFASDTHGLEQKSEEGQIQEYDRFEGIGDWPRRLLHVPSMTSLEWQPGDKYGDHVRPTYNAVSYTWGRYNLDFYIPGIKKEKRNKYRNVRAIEINGVDWRIPRINPEQFSTDQFLRLLQQTCEAIDGASEKIDFLWLDVACIDQKHMPQKMAEIGRQAVIFQGAKRAYIWLTAIDHDRLCHIIPEFLQSVRECSISYCEPCRKGIANG